VLSDKFNNGGGDTKRRRKEKGFVKYRDRIIPDCSLSNIPSRFAIAMTDRLRFIQKNEIIWGKPNGFPNGAAARRRFFINYEHVLFYVKIKVNTIFRHSMNLTTDPSEWNNNKGPRLGGRKAAGYGSAVYSGKYWVPNICGKIKRSIWEINTQKQRDKFYAAYLEKLVEIPINACCPPEYGSIVLDPFLGSGTTALVASKLNRKFIGIELCKEYVQMSHKRLEPYLHGMRA
jgi:DNA modification methylase